MLGLPRKKSKGPYLWRCWSSVLELHSRPRFLARNDLLQAVLSTCSDTWFGSLVHGEAHKDYKNLMPKKQQYHMKRRHDDVIISFERLQADFLNFGVILAITRLIQGRRPKRQRRAASKSHVGCNKGLKWKSETLTHLATLCRYIFCTDVGLLKLASSYCLLLLYKHLDVFWWLSCSIIVH